MVYALNDLKELSQDELVSFFSNLLKELELESDTALLSLKDKTAALKYLKVLGFGKDDKASNGASLLHYAAAAGLIVVVEALLVIGYANDQTKLGANIGHYAAQSGYIEAIKAFLNRGLIELHAKDGYGAGFILYAAYGGHLKTILSLIEMGLDKYETNSRGAGAIHYAVLGASIANIEALIELGYSPDALDKYGDSALHFAARFGRGKLVALLIEKYGLNPESENVQQESIFDLARQSGCQETINICSKY